MYPLTCSRWQDPVTSRAAPTNVISNQLAFCYCITLKQDGKALFILRHECRLPATPATLVEKIGERILVLACVSRQLDHNSLVFFHRELEIMSRLTSIVLLLEILGLE